MESMSREGGLLAQAADIAQGLSVEEYVIWWMQAQPYGQVNYIDFEPLIPDVCQSNIWRAFGEPSAFTEDELRDAVSDLDDQGQLSMRRMPVQQEATGSQGQPNPQKIHVIVTQR